MTMSQPEREELLAEIARLRRANQDLELSLTTAIEHGDAIEAQLGDMNQSMLREIAERKNAEKRLRKLLDIITQQKDDLEILIQTITEHGDQVELEWLEKFGEVEQQAKRDGLTGLANRRCFDEYLERQWRLALRGQLPMTLILCDIDYFKQYNDRYGHPAGDACLILVAGAMQRACQREVDLAARVGGEEFCIVLPDTDLAGGVEVAQRVQEELEALAAPHAGSSFGQVTLSLGVVSWIPAPAQRPADLFAEADRLLYCSKQQGRNRISHSAN